MAGTQFLAFPLDSQPSAGQPVTGDTFRNPTTTKQWILASVTDQSDASAWPAIPQYRLKSKAFTLLYGPGRAWFQSKSPLSTHWQQAYHRWQIDESELQQIDKELRSRVQEFDNDVAISFHVVHRNKPEWPRIRERIQDYTRLRHRLTDVTTRQSPNDPETRRLLGILEERSNREQRIEALSDLLETREDLYEGACDRIADHLGWHNGHVLELIIVVLLILEAVLMALDIFVHQQQ